MEKLQILEKSFLFSGIETEALKRLLEEKPPTTACFKRGELIYSSDGEAKVGFIMSGRCEVRLDRGDRGKTVLNILTEGDSFGILSVYSSDEFPTKVYATKNSDVLFFSAEQIVGFVNNNSKISANLINFLANRIAFLNKKILTFSQSSVEKRLATYLINESQRRKSDSFPFNHNKTAEEINAGRASVYRALASLEKEGLISGGDKIITIIDQKGLERISK